MIWRRRPFRCRWRLGGDDVFEEALQDVLFAQEVDEFCILCLELLDEVRFIEQLFEGDFLLVEESIEG